nr:MAG TPA: hypothetical protein [Caudoviricetes sp.]
MLLHLKKLASREYLSFLPIFSKKIAYFWCFSV